MTPVKTMCATAAFSLAALGSTAAHAAGATVLSEGFDDVGALAGWLQVNASVPAGSGWFQGNAGLFAAQSDPPDAYAAANFLGAANGGAVDNWLITPLLDLSGTTVLSFYTRFAAEPGFADRLEVRYAPDGGSAPADFTTLLATVGGAAGYPADWRQISASLEDDAGAGGSGRFAFRYLGPADTLSYIGLDTVAVVTAVPEPTPWTMLALGLGALPILRRQARP